MNRINQPADIGRILEIGRDPLFSVAYPDRADWVSTGRPIEPLNRHLGAPPQQSLPMASAIRRLRSGEYTLAMVPAIQARTPTDRHWARKALRGGLTIFSRKAALVNLFSKSIGLDAVPHLVRDVSDYPHIGDSDAGLFPRSLFYAKREVLIHDLGKPAHGDSGGEVVYLPMPFDISTYRMWMIEGREKNTDIFFAGKLHSPQRRLADRAARVLAEDGYKVDLPTSRLPYPEYLDRLARSWLVLSPKGHGEHCYRHYEALLMGSVPVINKPELPVYYALEHGKTALFHESNLDDLLSICKMALSARDRLYRIAAAGRELVEREHNIYAITGRLLSLVRAKR